MHCTIAKPSHQLYFHGKSKKIDWVEKLAYTGSGGGIMGNFERTSACCGRRALQTIAISFIILIGSGDFLQASPVPSAGADLPVVYAAEAKETQLFNLLSYPARINPRVVAKVLAEGDGVVTKILKPLGKAAKRGERLIEIRNTDPVYSYAAAYSRAPVTGIVSDLVIREGTNVVKNQELLTITNPEEVSIEVQIAAADLSALSPGATGELTVNGRSDSLAVQVIGISPFVNPATGTATCELSLGAPKPKYIRPGLVGQVTFKANARRGLTVPDYALFYRDGETYLRVVEAEVAKLVKVELGVKERGLVEITKGLKPGALVIERTNRFVGDGQKVKVEKPQAEGVAQS